MKKIYFDNAATTPLIDSVKDVLIDAIENTYGNPSSIHALGRVARSKIENARKIVAQSIDASLGEIFFTSSATEANNMVIRRSIEDLGVRRIITSPTEHHCILHTLDAIKSERDDVTIIYLKVNHEGRIDISELQEHLSTSDTPTLVSIMYVNNEIGTVQDVSTIGKLCKEYNAYFHCDAVQAIAKRKVSVIDTHFNFLTASGHKFHAPKGVGFLYMNQNNIIKPYIYGGAQERNMRAGTENVHGILALATALKEGNENLEQRKNKISEIKKYFISQANQKVNDIRINGSLDADKSAYHILSLSFPPSDKADLLIFNLDIAGVCASSGSACSAGIEEDSHVLMAIGHPTERKAIRFSFSHFNTKEEVDEVINHLVKLST